jgi:hypothetical protein
MNERGFQDLTSLRARLIFRHMAKSNPKALAGIYCQEQSPSENLDLGEVVLLVSLF